jgi:putative hydrolase of HD superfamily
MCLLHDLPETRTGDLNAVQKKYTQADEKKAVAELTAPLPFGKKWTELMEEFNRRETTEARLAHDADQIAFILDLKALSDTGYKTPAKWMDHITDRIKTDIGRSIAQSILNTEWDNWWLKDFEGD